MSNADPDDRPPADALPLAEALRELSGDGLLDSLARAAMYMLPPFVPSTARTLEKIGARLAEKTLARLRNDELDSLDDVLNDAERSPGRP